MCQHYFEFESPNGRTSKGTCKWCGTVKEDYNSFDYDKTDFVFPIPSIKRTPINNVDSILIKSKGSRANKVVISMASDLTY